MIALGPKRVVVTGLAPAEVMAALRRDVRSGGLFAFDRPGRDGAPLRGWVDGEAFSVVRRTQFRNSFTPIVEGKILASEGGGSQLQLTLGMHLIPFIAMLMWLVVVIAVVLLAAEFDALGEMALALVGVGLLGPFLAGVLYRADIDAVVQDITVAVTRPAGGEPS